MSVRMLRWHFICVLPVWALQKWTLVSRCKRSHVQLLTLHSFVHSFKGLEWSLGLLGQQAPCEALERNDSGLAQVVADGTRAWVEPVGAARISHTGLELNSSTCSIQVQVGTAAPTLLTRVCPGGWGRMVPGTSLMPGHRRRGSGWAE